MQTIHGSCHCGNLRFELGWPVDADVIPVRACGCTFCTKHRATYTSHPDATLEARVGDPDLVSRYTQGTGTAEFFVCRRCGVVPFVTSRIEGREYGVVNVNAFDPEHALTFDCRPTDFSGEDPGQRLARRRRTWIPDVRIFEA